MPLQVSPLFVGGITMPPPSRNATGPGVNYLDLIHDPNFLASPVANNYPGGKLAYSNLALKILGTQNLTLRTLDSEPVGTQTCRPQD